MRTHSLRHGQETTRRSATHLGWERHRMTLAGTGLETSQFLHSACQASPITIATIPCQLFLSTCMIFQKEPLCVVGTLHLAHKANATLTKILLQKNNIGDGRAVALAAAVKALFVTTFFFGSSAQSVLLFWICSSVAPMTPSRSFEVWGNRAFVSRKNSCFAACAVNISLMWSASCEIGGQCVVLLWCFLKRLCNVSGPEILLRENGSHSQCVCAHTVFVRVDNISIKPSKVYAQNWHDGTIRTRVFVGWRFVAIVFFCCQIEHVVSQRGRFGEIVGNMKEPGQGTSSEDLDTSFLHASRQMAG